MSALHGTCTSINHVGQLSSYSIDRKLFLDRALKAKVAAQVGSGKDVLFLGNDVSETRRKEFYQLIIHGILPCGSKTTLIINGIDPHVDVRLREGESDDQGRSRIDRMVNMIDDETAKISSCEFKAGKDFMYFDHNEHRYARVHFRSLKIRADFLAICEDQKVKTYSNDRSTYYRVVSRGYEINLSGWNIIRNYERVYGKQARDSKAEYSFIVDVNDIEPIADDSKLAEYAKSQDFDPSVIKYENMIISSFDIEMIPEKPDRFPDADKNPNDSIFMICITYHFVKRPESLLSVCLTLAKSDPLDSVFMVHCQSEGCLLAAFAKFMGMMQPDFITEFNGGGFDWRNIITKTRHCGMLGSFLEDMSLVKLQRWEKSDTMLSRFHRETPIKIGGATAPALPKGLKMQGFVAFDTLIVFKQLEPNADSHKLNECLRRCNLGSKDDLDIKEMFRMYREKDPKEMSIVAHYCFIDTFKLQQLLIKKNVVQDRREVANLSYTSLQDNFYFAGGSRMRNLLMNRGAKLGYFFDTKYRPEIEDPDAKFPGAHVVPPIKGIVKPSLRFDEYLTQNDIEHDEASLAEGYQFIEKHFEQLYHSDEAFDADAPSAVKEYVEYAKATQNQYPISGLDYASLYPSIIMTYNISPEKLIIDEEYAGQLEDMGFVLQYVTFPFCGKMVKAWFVRHNNVEDEYSICGKLLIELFARRASLKKVLKHLGEAIYEMEQEMKPFLERDALHEYPRIEEYNETKFDHICCDSKQKAVKVFMNTLYGEMGNFLSCICAVQVSASVTTMGKHNLLLAKAFVTKKLGMKVYYGDSVVGDTPIMIKRDGVKELVPIEELDDRYEAYVGGKECIDYTNENVSVMTEAGYSKIVKVIRHRTSKKLFRVTTHIGSVIVTEDHSLLDSKKQKITPQDCKVGTELLHWNIDGPVLDASIEDSPRNEAYMQGFNLAQLARVPAEILNGSRSTKLAFVLGYYAVGGFKKLSQIAQQGLYLLLNDLGYSIGLSIDGDLTTQHCKSPTAIKYIEEIGECNGYVYDLETESHHFAAGVGRMVVHNTDSLYVSCNRQHFIDYDREYFTGKIDKIKYGTLLVEETFRQIEVAKQLVNEHLIKDNGSDFLKMAYEEVLYPAAFLSKKKYYGVPHEDNVDFYPRKLFLRGLEIVKRGASDVLKDVVNEVLREAMDLKTTRDILDILKDAIARVFNTNWSIDAFAKTKVYRPDKKNIAVITMMDRYRSINYPTIPEPNVRFKYVICKYYPWTFDVEGRQTKQSTGDRMELLSRVHEEGLEIDLEYYFDNELTGQFARLITFCDRFADAVAIVEEIDVSTMDDTERDAYLKEQYQRSEDALFKAAKKYIGQLAKHYSKAYTNKSSLFKNTWSEVCNFITARPDIYNSHLNATTGIIFKIFASANTAGEIKQDLANWIVRYVGTRYKTTLADDQMLKLEKSIEPIEQYMNDRKITDVIAGGSNLWKRRVVEFIREEYDYDYICKANLPYDTIWDVLDRKEFELILSDRTLFPSVSADQAMEIIDMIVAAIANVLTAEQLA